MNRFLPICVTIVVATMVLSADDTRSTVAKLNEAWLVAYKAADFDSMVAQYTDDAVVMAAGREPIHGREAIRNFFAEDFKYVPKHSMATKSLRVEASGTLLVDSGDYKYDGINIEGKSVHIIGNYTTIFKKTDGKWHAAIEIWNVRTPEEPR